MRWSIIAVVTRGTDEISGQHVNPHFEPLSQPMDRLTFQAIGGENG